jgi:excisionase family DNA binding protein
MSCKPRNGAVPPLDSLPRLYLPEEVAGYLRISPRTVKRFIASGKLSVTRFGRSPRVSEEDLQTFLRERTCKLNENARANSSSSSADRKAPGTSVGTAVTLDRQSVFQLAQATSRRRARHSMSTPSATIGSTPSPTPNSPE